MQDSINTIEIGPLQRGLIPAQLAGNISQACSTGGNTNLSQIRFSAHDMHPLPFESASLKLLSENSSESSHRATIYRIYGKGKIFVFYKDSNTPPPQGDSGTNDVPK